MGRHLAATRLLVMAILAMLVTTRSAPGAGLLQTVHTNGALVQTASTDTRIVPTAALIGPDELRTTMWSASWVGTFIPDTNSSHFVCKTVGGRITAWVDDRMVCSTTPCEPKGKCDVGGGHNAEVNGTWPHWDAIPLRQAQNHTIHIHFIRDQQAATTAGLSGGELPSFQLLWARRLHPRLVPASMVAAVWPLPQGGPVESAAPTFEAIPTSMLQPWSTPAEQERTKVQAAAASGWGPWFRNDMLTQMHLPDMFGVSTTLVQRSTQQREGGVPLNGSFYGAIPRCPCYKGGPVSNSTGAGTWSGGKGSDPVTCDSASTDILRWPRSKPTVRVGPLAWDKSYSQLFVQWKGFNVSFETATMPSSSSGTSAAMDAHHHGAASPPGTGTRTGAEARKDLLLSITVVDEPSNVNRSDFVIGLSARFFFSRPVNLHPPPQKKRRKNYLPARTTLPQHFHVAREGPSEVCRQILHLTSPPRHLTGGPFDSVTRCLSF